MGFNNTPRGMFTISWEIKDADGISVAIEIPEGTTRLPYEYRKRIVQRLREKLLPPKAERYEILRMLNDDEEKAELEGLG